MAALRPENSSLGASQKKWFLVKEVVSYNNQP